MVAELPDPQPGATSAAEARKTANGNVSDATRTLAIVSWRGGAHWLSENSISIFAIRLGLSVMFDI